MVRLNGILKGVNAKSKVTDNNETIHTLEIKVELVHGEDPSKIQEVVENLKEMIELGVQSIQPALPDADDDKG
jgi:predicted methyltransferase MtxX (methanogen marker protein 4)